MIYDFFELLQKYGCEVQLLRISAPYGNRGLTQRQDELLMFAYSNGYFEYPKRIRIGEISRTFDVSPSTVSEILRAGQRRIFKEYFEKL